RNFYRYWLDLMTTPGSPSDQSTAGPAPRHRGLPLSRGETARRTPLAEWLALFTDDVRYWMPITETREVGQPRDHVPGEWSLMEDDSRFLAKRMERLAGGLPTPSNRGPGPAGYQQSPGRPRSGRRCGSGVQLPGLPVPAWQLRTVLRRVPPGSTRSRSCSPCPTTARR
ncbi:MAG: hypothetical protein M3492_07735, partial [Actinomycetota bacterium]|nr:hypothetical protein [Actinomycetota bacterium]